MDLTTGPRLSITPLMDVSGYLRHNLAFGYVSHDAPAYEHCGVRDGDLVRGLERGEFIGKCYLGIQNEAGINLFELWHELTPQNPQDDQTISNNGR